MLPIPSLLRNKNPTKTNNIPPTTNTLIKIVHGKRDSAIITKTQTTTWPHNNASRRTLTHHTLRAIFSHARCALHPGSWIWASSSGQSLPVGSEGIKFWGRWSVDVKTWARSLWMISRYRDRVRILSLARWRARA
ncbi:hypothetical protein EYC80_001929 [Monilinia laxa]|uniref:Uncharacterized protein n=1 Tax=Monilinia laxa TaxID=61186 RepID=A0A5N6K6H2_MONLA|nr:hypothetical protein EYC80_001929 [Monilinia laxa]